MENTRTNKFRVKLNSVEKIERLLQETYDIATQTHNSLQNEINKIANTTVVNELDIDGKEKYAKIMSNYYSLQQKANAQKQDIAKLMAEVMKHNGDIKGALADVSKMPTTLDLDKLRKLAADVSSPASDVEEYKTRK
jgi:hypothetical protein